MNGWGNPPNHLRDFLKKLRLRTYFLGVNVGLVCGMWKIGFTGSGRGRGIHDAPSNSLMDSTINPKVKIMEGIGVGTHSLACNTLGVRGCVGAPRWD